MLSGEIRIRDPFVLTDRKNGCYYLYGTTALKEGSIEAGNTFSVYRSRDLEHFEDPKIVVDGAKNGFWGDRDFWAPEVHAYNGKYYLFGSCRSENRLRATHIFVSDAPDGEFVPLSEEPITPAGWQCLDGTFWMENGSPYLVFSHEWTQIGNGEIWAMPLSRDLKRAAGEPFLLFRATDHPNVTALKPECYVTDGPFLWREPDGKTHMIWSSFCLGRYVVLEAESDGLHGTWSHRPGTRFPFDGGHAMLFTDLEGKRRITLHTPNQAGKERAFFCLVE